MTFFLALYAVCMSVGLARYARYATRHINALRTDLDELELRLLSAERALANQQ